MKREREREAKLAAGMDGEEAEAAGQLFRGKRSIAANEAASLCLPPFAAQRRARASVFASLSLLGPGRRLIAHFAMPRHADAEACRLTALEAWWHEDPV